MNSGNYGTGTGFFFRLNEKGDSHIPVIITNKHVIKNSKKGYLKMTLQNSEGGPDINNHATFEINNFEEAWIFHPDDNVDLCAMPIGPLVKKSKKQNRDFFYAPLDKSMLPSEKDWTEMFGMEEIIMIGYPNGIWDENHNWPIFRKGITASNPMYDWNGKKEFMIDAACFPGSSGSPVLLLNIGSYQSKKGYIFGKNRIKLLGVLYAGPQHTVEGNVEIIEVPIAQKPIAVSRIPNNLGLVIKSEKILDFENYFDS